MQSGLALLITVAPLEAGKFGAADAITLAYAVGMIEGELREIKVLTPPSRQRRVGGDEPPRASRA